VAELRDLSALVEMGSGYMLDQFFGTYTWWTVGGIVGVFLLALFGKIAGLSALVLMLLGVLIAYAAWNSLEVGMFVAFVEMFVGGHGRLLAMEVLGFSMSLRMVIFGVVMGVFLVRFLQGRFKINILPWRDGPWMLLMAAVVLGVVVGGFDHDGGAVFDDANGFLVVGYLLPVIAIRWTAAWRHRMLQACMGAYVWVTGLTLGLGYLFTHLPGKALDFVYKFVRDGRIAEVTLQTVGHFEGGRFYEVLIAMLGDGGYWFRVFLPNQFTILIGMFLLLGAVVWSKKGQLSGRVMLVVGGLIGSGAAALLLGGSRSFLVGVLAGGVCLVVLMVLSHLDRPQGVERSLRVGRDGRMDGVMKILMIGVGSCLVAFMTAWIVVELPVPARPDLSDAYFYSTSADEGRASAVASRWDLLDPMMDEIKGAPMLGSGFGEEITYQSSDPRVIAETGGGEWTTYRFEWGYLDIWLKMGVLGVLAFGWYLMSIFVGVRRFGRDRIWLGVALMSAVVALFGTHIFSPYLNHPIGIGFMVFVLVFFDGSDDVRRGRVVDEVLEKMDYVRVSVGATFGPAGQKVVREGLEK